MTPTVRTCALIVSRSIASGRTNRYVSNGGAEGVVSVVKPRDELLGQALTPIEEDAMRKVALGGEIYAKSGQSRSGERGEVDRFKRAMFKLGGKNRSHAVYLWTKQQPRPRLELPDTRVSINHRVKITDWKGDEWKVYITIGRYPNGVVGELFVRVGNQGSTMRGALDGWARMVSVSLQWGVPLTDIIHKFTDYAFEPAGNTNDKELPTCTSIMDYVVRWIEREEVKYAQR